MNRRKTVIFMAALLLCSMLSGNVYARADSTDRAGNLGEYVQRLYTAGSGLLSTAATAIAQTQDGMVWIGGYGGLVRYDGRNFEPCMERELGTVQALLADSRGRLWIASADIGLVCWEKGRFTRLTEKEGNKPVAAGTLAEGADGSVWFGTESGIGYVGGDMQEVLTGIPALAGEYITRILPAHDGGILCVSRSGELFRVNGGQAERISLGPDSRTIRSIAYDAGRNHYLAGTTAERFLVLDENLEILQAVGTPKLECINDILADRNGILWLCTDSGIGSWDGENLRIQRLDMDNSVDHMMIDREGSFWFTSSRQGVLEVCPSRFGNVSRSAGLENIVANAVAERDGRLYIGHDSGMVILDAASYEQIRDPAFSGLDGVRIRSIVQDGEGGLWFFTKEKGALHYDRDDTCRVYSSAEYPEIASDSFRCGVADGGVLLAGTDLGAYRIEGDTVSRLAGPPEAPACRVLCICGTQEQCLVGTDGYGLFEVRGGKITRHLEAGDGLGSGAVMKIVPGRAEQGWWLVLGSGLAWMDADGAVRQVPVGTTRNLLDIVVLEDSRVWLPAGVGIYSTTEQSLLAGEGKKARLYRSTDGIPFEVTANSNQCAAGGDMLYFCGTGGVISLDLAGKTAGPADYSLMLDYIRTDGKKNYVQGADMFRLPSDAHRIDFDVHVPTYRTEDPDVYYYLEGFDENRTVAAMASLGDITYTNLNAGRYVFHFGIDAPEGKGEAQELRITVVKPPLWYEHLWVKIGAVLLAAALLAGLIWLYFRKRLEKEESAFRQQLEADERERLRQIAYRDYLTGLYNRNYLTEWKEKAFSGAELPLFFVAIDCNDLKKVNDRFGHAAGDELLQKLSGLLQDEFGRDALVFRTGGDEFFLLVPGAAREALEKRITEVHGRAAQVRVGDVELSFCEGIFEMRQRDVGFDEAMTRADMDLLRTKNVYHGRE